MFDGGQAMRVSGQAKQYGHVPLFAASPAKVEKHDIN